MATSNSINFGMTRDDTITEALELIGVLEEGETPNADQLASCSRTLNLMVKAWQGKGMNIFAVENLFVFPDTTSQSYSLVNGSETKFTKEYSFTTMAVAGGVSDLSLELTDATGFIDTAPIGILLDTGERYWTTINGTPVGNTVTLTAGLTASVAVGNEVISYAVQGDRPIKVLEAYRRTSSGQDIPLMVSGDRPYNLLTPKGSAGVINTVWYDAQVASPKLYVWPVSSNLSDTIFLRVQRTLQDLDASSDDVDFPQEWYQTLAHNLALQITPKYGCSSEVFNQLRLLARDSLMDAEASDTEQEFKFYPEMENR